MNAPHPLYLAAIEAEKHLTDMLTQLEAHTATPLDVRNAFERKQQAMHDWRTYLQADSLTRTHKEQP